MLQCNYTLFVLSVLDIDGLDAVEHDNEVRTLCRNLIRVPFADGGSVFDFPVRLTDFLPVIEALTVNQQGPALRGLAECMTRYREHRGNSEQERGGGGEGLFYGDFLHCYIPADAGSTPQLSYLTQSPGRATRAVMAVDPFGDLPDAPRGFQRDAKNQTDQPLPFHLIDTAVWSFA